MIDGIKFRGIILGGVCDSFRLLVIFDSLVIDLDDKIVGCIVSSVDMNGGGDKGHRRGDGVFGCKNCPTVSGSSILCCISGVYKTW